MATQLLCHRERPILWQILRCFLHFIASALPAVSAQCSSVLDQCPCPAMRCVRVWTVIADHDVCLGSDHRQPCMASPLSPAALTGSVMGCLQEPARCSLAPRSENGRRSRVARTTSHLESVTHLLLGSLVRMYPSCRGQVSVLALSGHLGPGHTKAAWQCPRELTGTVQAPLLDG